MSLRRLWKRYCRQQYPKNATFAEIGKASATMDVGEFLRFVTDYGILPQAPYYFNNNN